MQARGLFLLLVLILLAVSSEAGKIKKDKVKKNGSDCEEWRWGPCIPNSKDCGVGFREGTCHEETKKLKCKIPCNWKKEFGADCKYKFESWGGCDSATGLKARSGTLKKALYNAECQETIQVTKPCSPKAKSKSKVPPGGTVRAGGDETSSITSPVPMSRIPNRHSARRGKGKD